MPEIAKPEEYRALMKLINTVFCPVDVSGRFYFRILLPKLYQAKYKPWERNYVVREGAALKAAVGMYIAEADCAGLPLRVGGIGNVAVARDSRRKGYMKQAMNDAMAAMAEAGCDIAQLGGQRQRYEYWGFDRAGTQVRAAFTYSSLRHGLGQTEAGGYTIAAPTAADLPQLQALIERAPLHIRHNPAAFGDILRSWAARPLVVKYKGEIVAYYAEKPARVIGIHDLQFFDWDKAPGALLAIYHNMSKAVRIKGLEVSIPLWETEFLALAERAAEWQRLEIAENFTVLNWERALRALLRLQCACGVQPDGELTVKINGYHGEETLRLRIEGNQAAVEPYQGEARLELDHLAAVRFFLAPVSNERSACLPFNPCVLAWFPLPLFLYKMEAV
ncbi:MAG: GNAT family N-acetyltransferase [Oscillospiraceae bacterium]|nr:GNAT family N-acetyltransferase [Oscillospiraceae bacterium]